MSSYPPFGTSEWITVANDELKAKPCKGCGEMGGMSVAIVFVAHEIGTFSLAGMQDKVSASRVLVMSHEGCGFRARLSEQ